MLVLVAAVAVTGFGGDVDDGAQASVAMKHKPYGAVATNATAPETFAVNADAGKGAVVKAANDPTFGSILTDRRGQALYLFDKEKSDRSECYGACSKAWPPLLTRGRPRAGTGAKGGLLGTTRRRGGKRQVTYRGHPLYYYVHDAPRKTLCHNVSEFGGLWLVLRANGRRVG